MVIGHGDTTRYLSDADVRRIVADGFAPAAIDGKRVLVLIPDATRTMPMPLMFEALGDTIGPRVAALDFLVALGTHQPLSDEQLGRLVGRPVADGRTGRSRVFNHRWDLDGTFAALGTIPAAEIADLSGGVLAVDVPVSLNRLLLDYDHLVICGPVFPHEVVGFSGGTKYLVPGVAGPDIINFTHWLGALITSSAVIGAGYTPVRAVVDRAASMVDRPVTCLSLVVTHDGIAGLYVGPPHDSWEAAAALSSRTHIVWVDRPFTRVLSVMPAMYDDLWTAAKGMYKLEPAMADGGEIVIFAPHITEVSYTHGHIIDEVGYHCRDYFLAQWDRFGHYPGGVLAHSTHVKGLGTYDTAAGIETPRITVTLATGIPEARCRRINLGYMDPAQVRLEEWTGREADGIIVVPRAGEMLYRLRPAAAAGVSHAK
ncbi:MAG TPA: lactate racemase domain-containing protein [Vicinamibacterales bacterium]|nr:lactate racemase domain-containing protein [Vicinamibacterales bacterium]